MATIVSFVSTARLWNTATNSPDHIALIAFLLLRFATWHPWIKSIIGRSWGSGQIDGWMDAHNKVTRLEPFELLREKQSRRWESDFISRWHSQPRNTMRSKEIHLYTVITWWTLLGAIGQCFFFFFKETFWGSRWWWWTSLIFSSQCVLSALIITGCKYWVHFILIQCI